MDTTSISIQVFFPISLLKRLLILMSSFFYCWPIWIKAYLTSVLLADRHKIGLIIGRCAPVQGSFYFSYYFKQFQIKSHTPVVLGRQGLFNVTQCS